ADSISDRFAPHAERVYHRTERMNDALDRQAFSTGFESLLALVVNGEHHLLHFDAATTVEEFDANLPIALIGSVRSHAAPFLPFLCEAMGLRASGLTDLRSAEIAVLWTLDQVIGSVAHGVGWPVQVVTLFRAGHGSYRAWELTPETLASHRAAIRRMAGALSAAAREEIQGADPRTRRALPARNGAAAWFGPDGVYPPLGLGGVPLQAIPEAPTRPNEPVHGRPTAIL
ncbi:MAG TPA: hypothetical protein VEI97_16500, partial [bacterium]|nr:hypothetical protein [bacterium]